MNKLTSYRLMPKMGGGFHFGQQGLELEESQVTFPSDSLFAALVATIAEQEGDEAAARFVQPFLPESYQPSFRLTSLFPCVGTLPLLPLPQLPIHTTTDGETAVPRKFTKKVRFVSPEIFKRLCAAEAMDNFLDEAKDGRFLQERRIWLTSEEQSQLPEKWQTLSADLLRQQPVWHQGNVNRVTIDRQHQQSMVYLMGRVRFNQDCGLWLGVEYLTDDLDARQKLEHLLIHLGDRGIGGERANGFGQYTVDTQKRLRLPKIPEGNGYHLLLSRYYPKAQEVTALQQELSGYALVAVGGWLTPSRAEQTEKSLTRRKQLRMVEVGSVLGTVEGQVVVGQTIDVRPNGFPHGVYRCGLAVVVPVKATSSETGES